MNGTTVRYRHPGDAIRLIAGSLVFAASLAAVVVADSRLFGAGGGRLLGPGAGAIAWLGAGAVGRFLIGLAQVAYVVVVAGVAVAALGHRRLRLVAGVVGGAVVAGAAVTGVLALLGSDHPDTVTANLRRTSWLVTAAFPAPALLAGAAALTVAASPWLNRRLRRTAWIMLAAVSVVRLITGTILPAELVLALAAGVTAGAGVLVAFGVPDRRMGPDGIAAALRLAGVPVGAVAAANVESRGSRPFVAVANDGRELFIKTLGSDQRDADLLYRAYRFVRLRNVGDARPAASLFQAVEHQALVAMMAERAGVRVPRVDRVVKTHDGTALLVMEKVGGSSLAQVPAEGISDGLLLRLWTEVDTLHNARIAHRSLRAANVMVDPAGQPLLVDFSFSELAASKRQMELDVAELLASLATLVGADRAVSSATAVIGASGMASAAPLLQPLALSAATRRAIARGDGLLAKTRSAAAAASGHPDSELARIQRVRPRTLLAIAALAGAFYYLLPRLAQVGGSWQALQSAEWAWLPVVIAASALTYLASAISLLGGVPDRVPLWPTVLTQAASSFVNRVSPANVGGMALNARYLQKSGVNPAAGVAAVGVNSLAGALVHLVLIVIFFAWSGAGLARAFKLPSGGKILLVLALVIAVVGVVLVSRQGRRFAARRMLPALASSAASMRQVAVSPVKLTMLFAGSALVTLAYIGGFEAAVQAFGGGPGIVEIGAVYLGAATIAAVAPTPGGLGAIEAALIAGLTGIGVASGPAVSAVLTYRLATYWLPVVPGWLSWRYLQRRGHV